MATPFSLLSRPEEALWAEYLESLIEWQTFAIFLPRIRHSDIKKIEKEETGKVDQQKMALWSKWTSVYPSGSWDDVVAALKRMKENELAEEIEKKLKKEEELSSHAVQILSSFKDDIIKSDFDPVALATSLNKEKILSDEALAVIKEAEGSDVEIRAILFSFVKVAVKNKYSNLYAYGSVLHDFFDGNLGKNILHDYGKSCVNVVVPVDKSELFSAVRIAFGDMHEEVCKVIMKSPPDLNSVKKFVKYRGKKKLVLAHDMEGVLDHIIYEECSLIDVQFLHKFLDKFEISAAKTHATKYEEYIKEQCKDLAISLCLDKKLEASKSLPLLMYNTIVYVFDWEPNRKCGLTLEDVTDILSKASGKLVQLRHINSKFSVAVVCSFSYSQTGLVIAMNQKNLDFLIKKGLKELTIGYCTIWRKEENEKHQYDSQTADKSSHDVKNNAEEVVKPQSELLGTEEDANDILEQELSENNEEKRTEFEEENESVISKKDQNDEMEAQISRQYNYEIETLQEKITKQHSEILMAREKNLKLEEKMRLNRAIIHENENLKALLDEKEAKITELEQSLRESQEQCTKFKDEIAATHNEELLLEEKPMEIATMSTAPADHGTGSIPPSANGPEVKDPPPAVKPKPKRGQSQTAIEASTAVPEPKRLDLSKWSQESSADSCESAASAALHGSKSLEYITLGDMTSDLVNLLAGNAPVITQLNNHLFSSGLIADAVHNDAQKSSLSPFKRASKMLNAVLATLKSCPNPNSVFASLITSLHKVGLTTIATKLMESFRKNGGKIDINLEQAQAPTISQTQSSSTSPTVIELSSKSEVASKIESLHSTFADLNSKLRDELQKLVKTGTVDLTTLASYAAAYLRIKVSSLKYTDVDELFDSLKPFYDFFSCGVLQYLTNVTYMYLSTVYTEITQHIENVDKFSETSQLKLIRSTIKEKLSSEHTKPVVIKLNNRWAEMTIKNFKRVLQYYFEPVVADLFSHISITTGPIIITLLIPTTLTQYLIDRINEKTESMKRLGIMEVAVDNHTIAIKREDDNNLDVSLHESVKAGESCEVSVLLQLGADPNNKDEEGKNPVEIAIEGGHNKVIQTLLTGGAIEGEKAGKVEWDSYSVSLTQPSLLQCLEVISKLEESNCHEAITLSSSSSSVVHFMLPQLLEIRAITEISIKSTEVTRNNIDTISSQLSNNETLKTLEIIQGSINDNGVTALAQSLKFNKSITELDLSKNPGITSDSAQSLAELLHNNDTLKNLKLFHTNIDSNGMMVLLAYLEANMTLKILRLDRQHQETCNSYPNTKNRLRFV